ncbi:MAG: hypothetical protein NZM00_05235, partial [Anaerolinea sp.]|nr:hypothetical protein [Anaerolinea sp.]
VHTLHEHTTSAETIARVRQLILDLRRAGAVLIDRHDRDYVQSLVNFWAHWIAQRTAEQLDTELYPLDPAARLSAREAGTAPAREALLRPVPGQGFPTGSSALVGTGGSGLPFIMVNLIKPAHNARVYLGETLTLTGIYANLQQGWRLYFIGHSQDGAARVLDPGSTVETGLSGMWEVISRDPFPEAGTYHLGVLVAITPDAAAMLSRAYNAGTALRTALVGVLPFTLLSTVIVHRSSARAGL